MVRVEVLWEDETGTPHVVPAKLEDKSRSGASLRIKEPITVGTKLVVQSPYGQFSGVVTYCNRSGENYVLGILRDPADGSDQK